MAVSVERLWPTDTTGRVPVRVQNDFGIDKVPGGDPLVQNLEESGRS